MADNELVIRIPDVGGADDVDVIEVLVSVGDVVEKDAPLLTLEGDKATMEIPSPASGTVSAVHVAVGDKVSEGTEIAMLSGVADIVNEPAVQAPKTASEPVRTPRESAAPRKENNAIYAGPAVRRIARELDINLAKIRGTGDKGRISIQDVKNYLTQGAGGAGLNIAKQPVVDFAQFGPVETQALSKIKKSTGRNLSRNWVVVPHVTQFDEVDITALEAYRQQNKQAAIDSGYRLTALVFILKAVVSALKAYPQVNASLSADASQLVLKQYFHIGVAVDTPNGLVVPVIRDVDKKDIKTLAQELAAVSEKARTVGLSMKEMQGGCFTVSSLGGIGGTAFTPIVNLPEAAILGVSRAMMKPIYQKSGEFLPKLMLPLSLSYDHRIIDGALGARFVRSIAEALTDYESMIV